MTFYLAVPYPALIGNNTPYSIMTVNRMDGTEFIFQYSESDCESRNPTQLGSVL